MMAKKMVEKKTTSTPNGWTREVEQIPWSQLTLDEEQPSFSMNSSFNPNITHHQMHKISKSFDFHRFFFSSFYSVSLLHHIQINIIVEPLFRTISPLKSPHKHTCVYVAFRIQFNGKSMERCASMYLTIFLFIYIFYLIDGSLSLVWKSIPDCFM